MKSTFFKCSSCGSNDLNIISTGGGCDSCSYGSSCEISCNECYKTEDFE